MQVEVNDIKTHIAGTNPSHDSVQIGAIIVVQAARVMDQASDLQDIAVKDAHSVGIGQHQAGNRIVKRAPESFQIHTAFAV